MVRSTQFGEGWDSQPPKKDAAVIIDFKQASDAKRARNLRVGKVLECIGPKKVTALIARGYLTLADIVEESEEYFAYAILGFGPKTAKKISDIVESHGLKLKRQDKTNLVCAFEIESVGESQEEMSHHHSTSNVRTNNPQLHLVKG